MVLEESARGIRQDSILLGINFGDSRNDFYGKCFDLNKEQLVSQGPSNSSVQYLFTDSLVHEKPQEIRLLFFPTFDKNDKIAEMNLELSYMAWAPWNEGLQSDSLKGKVMDLLVTWYGGNNFVLARVHGEEIPVKVDGNRRILIFLKDRQSVTVKIQDIQHPKFKHSET